MPPFRHEAGRADAAIPRREPPFIAPRPASPRSSPSSHRLADDGRGTGVMRGVVSQLWHRLPRSIPSVPPIRRQDPQRRQAGDLPIEQPTSSAGDQSQDRQGPSTDYPQIGTRRHEMTSLIGE